MSDTTNTTENMEQVTEQEKEMQEAAEELHLMLQAPVQDSLI